MIGILRSQNPSSDCAVFYGSETNARPKAHTSARLSSMFNAQDSRLNVHRSPPPDPPGESYTESCESKFRSLSQRMNNSLINDPYGQRDPNQQTPGYSYKTNFAHKLPASLLTLLAIARPINKKRACTEALIIKRSVSTDTSAMTKERRPPNPTKISTQSAAT